MPWIRRRALAELVEDAARKAAELAGDRAEKVAADVAARGWREAAAELSEQVRTLEAQWADHLVENQGLIDKALAIERRRNGREKGGRPPANGHAPPELSAEEQHHALERAFIWGR